MVNPGTTVETIVYSTFTNDGYRISIFNEPGYEKHTATWKIPTVKLWWDIHHSQDYVEREILAWKILLVETSLAKSFDDLMKFYPPQIPKYLVGKFLSAYIMTAKESSEIERDVLTLWNTKAKSNRRFHPMVERVSNALALNEKLGIQSFPDRDEMDIKTYSQILKVLESINIVVSMNEYERRLRAEAGKKVRG
jgi:hypothetical protein